MIPLVINSPESMVKVRVMTVKDYSEKTLKTLHRIGVLHIEEGKELKPVDKAAIELEHREVSELLTFVNDVLSSVADILGANMLDTAHLFTVDLFYSQGPILSAVEGVHIITAGVIMVMSLLVIFGCRFRQKGKTFIIFSWYTPLFIGLYIFGAYALFKGIGLC